MDNVCNHLSFIDREGRIRQLTPKYVELVQYYNLQCLLMRRIGIIDLFYPTINYASNRLEILKQYVDIGMEADKAGVQLLRKEGVPEYPLYSAFMPKSTTDVLLLHYLNGTISGQKEVFSPIHYMRGVLYRFAPEDIRGYYLRYYLLKDHPVAVVTPPRTPDTHPEHFYQKRYDAVKKYDKFRDFDKRFTKVKREGIATMKRVLASSAFKKYAKIHSKKIVPYHFSVSDMFGDTLSPKQLVELEKYADSL